MNKYNKKTGLSIMGFTGLIAIIVICVIAFAITASLSSVAPATAYYKNLSSDTWATTDGAVESVGEHYTYVTFKFTEDEGELVMNGYKLKSIWINFLEMPTSQHKFYIASHSSLQTSGDYGYGFGEVTLITDETMSAGDWICLATNYKVENVGKGPYFTVAIPDELYINEMAFAGINSSGELVALPNVSIYSAGVVENKTNSIYSAIDETSDGRIANVGIAVKAEALIDQQETFDVSKIDRYFDSTETNVLNRKENHYYLETGSIAYSDRDIKNASYILDALYLINPDDPSTLPYVNENANIVAQYLNVLSVKMFGSTAFAIYFMPIVATIGALIFLYFALKKYGIDEYISLAVLAIYAVVSVALTIGGVMIFVPIAGCFIAGAFYFMSWYFSNVDNTKNSLGIPGLALSGVFAYLAILSKLSAFIVMPALIALFVIRLIKDVKQQLAVKKLGKKAHYDSVINSCVAFLLGYVFAGALLIFGLYMILGQTFAGYYGVETAIEVIGVRLSNMIKLWF